MFQFDIFFLIVSFLILWSLQELNMWKQRETKVSDISDTALLWQLRIEHHCVCISYIFY